METVERKYKVLVVDDERSIRNVLKIHFRRQGIYCDVAASMYEALKKMGEEEFHLFILDLRLPDGDGIQILKEAKRRYPRSVALMITAYGTIEKAVEAIKLGAFDFITKPFKMTEFKSLVEMAFQQLDLQEASREEEKGFLAALGKSGAVKELENWVEQLAPSRVPVLIVGETGTGKSLVAEVIHRRSSRKDGPFEKLEVPVSPPPRLEEELFGRIESGSIKEGLVGLAQGGTIYVGRVENLPLHLQAKLLSLLEEGRYRVPGSVEVRETDVRCLFSVEDHPGALVEKGVLSEEFYYRLKNLEIYIPPLRERREDIPYLLNRFITEFSERYEKTITGFTPGFLEAIRGYPFPGNVRELGSLVERCVVLTRREVLHEDLLPPDLKGDQGETLDELLENIEREMIIKALKEAGGVQTKAAEMLGISFRSLRYRLRKLGIKN